MLRNEIATLINIPEITNRQVLGFALKLTYEYFADANWNQPPLPEDVIMPSRLLITSRKDENKRLANIGRIQFLREDDTAYFDQEWSIN